jgi:hypothetical protein
MASASVGEVLAAPVTLTAAITSATNVSGGTTSASDCWRRRSASARSKIRWMPELSM